jgi:heme-degrading monooxygenase HmoA
MVHRNTWRMRDIHSPQPFNVVTVPGESPTCRHGWSAFAQLFDRIREHATTATPDQSMMYQEGAKTMYVRMITFHARADVTRDDAATIYQELFNSLRGYQGFEGMTALINEDNRQAISLTYWRDEQCAAEAGTASLPFLMEKVHGLIDRPPEVTGYEMIAHELQSDGSTRRN